MTSGHWKDKKNSFKKRKVNGNERQIEESEEEHDMTKTSENKHKKIDFEEELSKQSHLNTTEKEALMTLWKNTQRNF